jgi:uncharacterized damage-inducible protein DinB
MPPRVCETGTGELGEMMKTFVIAVLVCCSSFAQNKPAPTLRSILLEQLRSTHKQKEWFVPVMGAVEGLTAQQASWKDSGGNHSVGQLVNHLLFWNSQVLARLKGEKPAPFGGNNDDTFNSFDAKSWKETVQKLDDVLTSLEKLVEGADDAKVQEWASEVAHIGTHNAYHTGQIITVRRLQGSWDTGKGVK